MELTDITSLQINISTHLHMYVCFMNKRRIYDIGLGFLLGIIIVSIIMLLIPGQTKDPLTATLVPAASPVQEPSTEPVITPVQYQDDELASDIIRTSSSLDTLMKLVQTRIDEGDLNGAMAALNVQYTTEMAAARDRSDRYTISPNMTPMNEAWNAYLNELPMLYYRTQMQIENIGKNYYAKAHADKITADKIQQRADQYRMEAVALARGEPYTKKESNQVQLPFSYEDI